LYNIWFSQLTPVFLERGRGRGFLFTYKDSARDPESNEMEAYSPTPGGV
jgi:hypothetical protein